MSSRYEELKSYGQFSLAFIAMAGGLVAFDYLRNIDALLFWSVLGIFGFLAFLSFVGLVSEAIKALKSHRSPAAEQARRHTVAGSTPSFQAMNRGILMATLIGGGLLCSWIWAVGENFSSIFFTYPVAFLGQFLNLFGLNYFDGLSLPVLIISFLDGIVGGLIVAFSNADERMHGGRDLGKNLSNVAMAFVASTIVSGAFNWSASKLISQGEWVPILSGVLFCQVMGSFLIGLLIGVLGEPAFRWVAGLGIKGRKPFQWVNQRTKDIEDPDLRFIVRVLAQCAMLVALVSLTYVAIVVLVIGVVLALLFLVIRTVLADQDGTPTARVHSGESGARERRQHEERERKAGLERQQPRPAILTSPKCGYVWDPPHHRQGSTCNGEEVWINGAIRCERCNLKMINGGTCDHCGSSLGLRDYS